MMSTESREPIDNPSEQYRELIRQNDRFVWAMTLALKSGAESAAAMTATVRTKGDSKRILSGSSDSTRAAA
jgi:hypothetical protein